MLDCCPEWKWARKCSRTGDLFESPDLRNPSDSHTSPVYDVGRFNPNMTDYFVSVQAKLNMDQAKLLESAWSPTVTDTLELVT